jgi:hypothetical protein
MMTRCKEDRQQLGVLGNAAGLIRRKQSIIITAPLYHFVPILKIQKYKLEESVPMMTEIRFAPSGGAGSARLTVSRWLPDFSEDGGQTGARVP